MNVRIKYHADIPHIQSIQQGDWIDLYAAEDISLGAMEFHIIPLGISMKLPDGYEAHLAPRSSTFKKWGILQVNSVGVIDNSYSGDNDIWGFPAMAIRPTDIHKGDRIAQFRIVKKCPTSLLKKSSILKVRTEAASDLPEAGNRYGTPFIGVPFFIMRTGGLVCLTGSYIHHIL